MTNWATTIENDLNWREAELASIKVVVSSAKKGSVRERVLLRALWVLLYAHYEGFCKFAWETYLDALEELSLPRNEYIDEIANFSLGKDFAKLRGNLSDDSIWKFCKSEFSSLLSLPAIFKERLETKNNLWPDLLIENSQKISLPTSTVNENLAKLKALVARRNEIAHGQKMVIKTLTEYVQYEHAALLVMHELAISIIDSLENKIYLKAI